MATDSHSHSRKHHRSPSTTTDSPKRHKHHRHHRRHRSKKHEEQTSPPSPENQPKEQEEQEVIIAKKAGLVDYDDMEEGEIVEDDDGGGNRVGEGDVNEGKKLGGDLDVESGEFKGADWPITEFDDSHMDVDVGSSKKFTRYLKSPGSDQSGDSKDGVRQSHNDETLLLESIANGDHHSRSSKRESRSHSRHKSHGKECGKGKERHRSISKHSVLDIMDVDDGYENLGDKRNLLSQKVGEVRHEHRSPSHAKNHVETASESIRSESPDLRRERSQSIAHDRNFKERHLRERDEGLYDNGKVGYEVDDERDHRSRRHYKDDGGEKVRDIGTKRGFNYHISNSRGGKYEDDSWDKWTRELYHFRKGGDQEVSKERSERDLDRSSEKVLHSYSSRDREREKDYVRDKERSRGTKNDIDCGKNCDESCNRDLYRERDRRRDKDRGRSRDRDFDRERVREDSVSLPRDKDNEWDRARGRSQKQEIDVGRDRDRHKDKDRGSVDYRSRRYHKYDDRVDDYGNRDRRRSHEEAEYKDRRMKHDSMKQESAKVDSSNKKEDSDLNDDDDQNNYQETVELKLVDLEEEDVDRIKEESRKRREAILQKYKTKQLQNQQEQQTVSMVPKVSGEQLMEYPSQNLVSRNSFQEESNGIKNNENSSSVNDSGAERGTVALGEGSPKSEKSNDMFCDDMFGDDIFGESPAGHRKSGKGDGLLLERSGLHDNWDDPEGYYSFRLGEVLDSRYEIAAAHGKGVFSTVVRAKDLKAGIGDAEDVAIKIIRNNETMLKAGTEELVILKKLVGADPEDRRHCVRYLSHFKYRNHLCIVFESLHMNLREVLKKFGRNIGLKLTAVRTYAKQLFIALKHLRNCGVLHCDIKPDNMLVNDAKNVLKLCDFGNAMFAGKNEITPYLVSRFYRAPEIILGLPYDHPMDIWSVGCCLYELYTGKVLFPGPTNNDMLRLHMELKGPFPKKMLRKGAFIEQHFDQDLNFLAVEEDPVTKKAIRRLLVNIRPKDIGNIIEGAAGEDPKMLANFKDLLDKVFVLDPDKRLTVSQALNHPFITGK